MLINIESPAAQRSRTSRFALFRLGFRPFYLAAVRCLGCRLVVG